MDGRGKAALAESGFIDPLLKAGLAVFAIDLRGRGETLGHIRPRFDTNFRLVANQVLMGQPLAGRRAFDLIRAVDYIGLRPEVTIDGVTVVGLGDDALPILLAAAYDPRIGRVAVSKYFRSFISQMAARPATRVTLPMQWNDPQLNGIINTGDYDIDFGSVIPGVLQVMDVPDLLHLIAPRKLLFCAPRDLSAAGFETLPARFNEVAGPDGEKWMRYEPEHPLDAKLLLERIGLKP